MSPKSEEDDATADHEHIAQRAAQLRADVLAALKTRYDIAEPDGSVLESSIRYGDNSFYDQQSTLPLRTIRKLKVAIGRSVAEIKEEPENARLIVLSKIFRAFENIYDQRLYYAEQQLSEWQIEHQPDPETFRDLLKDGEDTRFIALTMMNIWGSKKDFAALSAMIGNDIASWDNRHSLDYKEHQANRPKNKNLCHDMRVKAAHLVAIEPYIDTYRDFHYDLYGTDVAEVTSFAISFIPKKGVRSRTLQRDVENAVRRMIEDGEITFCAPTSDYKKPHNAYKRPTAISDNLFDDYNEYWDSFLDFWKIKNPLVVNTFWDFFYTKDDETGEVFSNVNNVSGHLIRQWALCDDFPENVPDRLMNDINEAAESAESFRHTSINDDDHVVLNDTLILDDVLQLYEFCDSFLIASPSIAHELEAARYAEECGPLISPGGLGDDYSKTHLRLTDQLGNFDGVNPEQIVDKALHDILALYGRGHKAQLAFLQVASLAHGTLTGVLPDGTGQFPTLKQITDGVTAEKTTALAEIVEENLTERTGQLLQRSVALFGTPNSEIPLREQFEEAASTMDQLLRYQQRIEDICTRYMRDIKYGRTQHKQGNSRRNTGILAEIDDVTTDSNLLAKERQYALECLMNHKLYEPRQTAIDVINAMEGRSDENARWVLNDNKIDRSSEADKKARKAQMPANQLTNETPVPDHLDALNAYIWRHCRESALQKISLKDRARNFLPTLRANIARHAGITPPQLPRDFEGTYYVTRPAGSPFPRPNTDLPEELAALLPKKPTRQQAHIQLPDPDVIWGRPSKPQI